MPGAGVEPTHDFESCAPHTKIRFQFYFVPREGVEPSQSCLYAILSRARLPIPPPRQESNLVRGKSANLSRTKLYFGAGFRHPGV